MAKDAKELFSDITFIFKLVELGLAITGMAIMIDRDTGVCRRGTAQTELFNMAFSSYALIIFILILAIIFDELGKFVVLAFLIAGFIFNVITTIVAFLNYFDLPSGYRAGNCFVLALLALILAIIMIVDIIFTSRK